MKNIVAISVFFLMPVDAYSSWAGDDQGLFYSNIPSRVATIRDLQKLENVVRTLRNDLEEVKDSQPIIGSPKKRIEGMGCWDSWNMLSLSTHEVRIYHTLTSEW